MAYRSATPGDPAGAVSGDVYGTLDTAEVADPSDLSATYGSIIPPQLDGLQLWLRADSLGLSDGDSVSTWRDESGENNDLTQGTAADQPTLQTNQLNGLPVVRGDGDNHLDNSSAPTSASQTILIVGKFVTDVSGNERIFGRTSRASVFNDGSNYDYFSNEAGNIVSGGGTSTNYTIITLRYNSATDARMFLDGVDATGSFDPDDDYDSSNLALFATDVFENDPSNADIAEFVYYNLALSDSEREQVEQYLSDKYGLGL